MSDSVEMPAAERRSCPACGELIVVGALLCRYCQSRFSSNGELLQLGGNSHNRSSYEHARLWAFGDILVANKRAKFPAVCIKTGEPATATLRRTLWWHPGWVYIFLVSPALYAIVALVTKQSAEITIYLGEEALAKRRRGVLSGAILVCIGIACFFMAALHKQFDFAWIWIGVLLVLGGVFWGFRAGRVISAKEIGPECVYIKGACQKFLNQLPHWRG